MRYPLVLKFIAILLAALCIVTALGSALGILVAVSMDQYTVSFNTWYQEALADAAQDTAYQLAERYAVNHLSNCPGWLMDMKGFATAIGPELSERLGLVEGSWTYTIADETGSTLEQGEEIPSPESQSFLFTVSPVYPVASTVQPDHHFITYTDNDVLYFVSYVTAPVYTVRVELLPHAVESYNGIPVALLSLLYEMRYWFIGLVALSFLVFAICAVYLCCAAGKTAKDSAVRPSGLNRAPLDLYLGVAIIGCTGLTMLAYTMLDQWIFDSTGYRLVVIPLAAVIMTVAAVLFVGFCFAAAAQFKAGNYFWWHHSIIGWLVNTLFRGCRYVLGKLIALVGMLPVIWRYLLIGAGMGLLPLLFLIPAIQGSDLGVLLFLLCLLVNVAMICYGGYAYGILLKGAARMAEGDLNRKIETQHLLGGYRSCAESLNALADVATVAAKNQMRSERMKTELITNVTHDIKTPLTSIINYVDLLQKPHTPEDGEQYLEVLSRQSLQLKKLIDDLMEMSKAASGNMAVEINCLDATETLTQALGEFSDKLAAADLHPLFRHPDGPVMIAADGRLTWRVLSNLFSNTVKYALPGTRVYVDLLQTEDFVLISLKNISREPLNISADELTERFVRGDASRNTEGSGLGLNIAQSLMELQKGHLELLVDGDLFKVTLVFPSA